MGYRLRLEAIVTPRASVRVKHLSTSLLLTPFLLLAPPHSPLSTLHSPISTQVLQIGASEADCAALLALIDRDGSGAIDCDEFVRFFSTCGSGGSGAAAAD
jgi:hypothetical protein